MRILTAIGVLSLLAAAAFSQPASAQAGRPGPETGGAVADAAKPGAAGPDADAVARLTLASRLAAVGRETGSPFALAAAAELFASVGFRDSGLEKERTEGGEAPASGSSPTGEPAADADALFAEASALAGAASNQALASLIGQAAAAGGSRRLAGRSARHRDRVNPHATDVYRVRYLGGAAARATVAADDPYDIDLFVLNSNGNLIAYDNDPGSIGVCSWLPGRTGDYYLNVKNMTSSQVSYLIYTN
jgi:hypothetical protein